MERLHRMPAKKSVIPAVSLCIAAALSGCSSASPATDPPPASTTQAASTTTATFTVAGDNPVQPNGSQDTHAQTPDSECDPATFTHDEALGSKIATGFALTGFPASAALLRHFLKGTGTEVSYEPGSQISKKALASTAFRTVDDEVQRAIRAQLDAGKPHVQLTAAQLPTVAFENAASDLYWAFRGTQGLTVTGSGTHEDGSYKGTLTYVIRDSYGFPASDTLGGFGAPMRYLQTACGAPQHPGGAHWFPDTITVTVALQLK
jgi:hypothetical protein